MAVATFAAGCFWGVQFGFDQLPGVLATQVGYTGGHVESPDYRQVCSGTTGHAEAVRIEFDPSRISYGELLRQFWQCHDPTQVNRQGPDIGTQYRSAIFVHSEEQRNNAELSRKEEQASGRHAHPIATEINEAGPFWEAEEYHQHYVAKQRGLR